LRGNTFPEDIVAVCLVIMALLDYSLPGTANKLFPLMENTKIIGTEQSFSYFPFLPFLLCCIFFVRDKLTKSKIVRSLEDVA
jgi:hypothetical protein